MEDDAHSLRGSEREGESLGIFPTPITESFDALRVLIEKHPGADVRSTVSEDNPCSQHPAD